MEEPNRVACLPLSLLYLSVVLCCGLVGCSERDCNFNPDDARETRDWFASMSRDLGEASGPQEAVVEEIQRQLEACDGQTVEWDVAVREVSDDGVSVWMLAGRDESLEEANVILQITDEPLGTRGNDETLLIFEMTDEGHMKAAKATLEFGESIDPELAEGLDSERDNLVIAAKIYNIYGMPQTEFVTLHPTGNERLTHMSYTVILTDVEAISKVEREAESNYNGMPFTRDMQRIVEVLLLVLMFSVFIVPICSHWIRFVLARGTDSTVARLIRPWTWWYTRLFLFGVMFLMIMPIEALGFWGRSLTGAVVCIMTPILCAFFWTHSQWLLQVRPFQAAVQLVAMWVAFAVFMTVAFFMSSHGNAQFLVLPGFFLFLGILTLPLLGTRARQFSKAFERRIKSPMVRPDFLCPKCHVVHEKDGRCPTCNYELDAAGWCADCELLYPLQRKSPKEVRCPTHGKPLVHRNQRTLKGRELSARGARLLKKIAKGKAKVRARKGTGKTGARKASDRA